MLQQFAAGGIKPLTHSRILRHIVCHPNRTVFAKQVCRRIVGCMRQEGRIPDEKWRGLLHSLVDKGKDRLHPLTTDLQPLISMTTSPGWIAMGHAMRKPTISPRAFPPLARLVRHVALGHKRLHEGWKT